jgi:hypothetical protein
MGSVLQTANVHFDSTGSLRIGKDGTDLVIIGVDDIMLGGVPLIVTANSAYDKANAANITADSNQTYAANVVMLAANTAYGQANTNQTYAANVVMLAANTAYGQANTNQTYAANNVMLAANSAYAKANAANITADYANNIVVGNVVSGTYTVQSTRNKLNFVEGTNITFEIEDDSAGDRANVTIIAAGGGGSVTAFTANIGNNSGLDGNVVVANANTVYVVTHNLNTQSIFFTMREFSSGYYVYPDMMFFDANTCNVEFASAPTANQYFLSILGAS